ncbi:MAG: gfo/Idh/MocA family oxidoreductase, partial [Luminiphilus sp.]
TPDHPAYRGLEVTYPDTIERSGHSGATFFEHLAWVTQLEGGEADAATPLQGFWSLVVASAAQQSLASGEVILIDEFCAGQGITLPSHG